MQDQEVGKNTVQLDGIYAKGYGVVPRLVMEDASIDVGAKCFYAYLCTYAGANGSCYPSRDKIRQALGISKDTVSTYTEQLVKAGYICVNQVREKGRFCRNVYVLNCIVEPCPKKPCPAEPCPKKPDTINTSNINNNIYNTPYTHNLTTFDYESPPKGDPTPKGGSKRKKEFIPPTLDEVAAYCASRGNKVDANKFWKYYNATDWTDSKGEKVRSWKHKCITWELSETAKKESNHNTQSSFDTDEFFAAAVAKSYAEMEKCNATQGEKL